MNKTDLISLVAKNLDMTKASVSKCIDTFLETVQQQVAAGEKVALIGFGTLETRMREARTCHNPRTGEPMDIEARRQIRFVPGKKFKDLVQDCALNKEAF